MFLCKSDTVYFIRLKLAQNTLNPEHNKLDLLKQEIDGYKLSLDKIENGTSG